VILIISQQIGRLQFERFQSKSGLRSFPDLASGKGDQIGRIFAYWAIAYFGQIFENYKISGNFLILLNTVIFMH
jgi:hypothetical protein